MLDVGFDVSLVASTITSTVIAATTKTIAVHGARRRYQGAIGVMAVAVESARGVYLVAFRAPTVAAADKQFSSLIRTFDLR